MEKYLNKLEYNKILEKLASHCKTYIGKNTALNLMPISNAEKVSELLAETTEGCNVSSVLSSPPISFIPEIELWIKQLNSGWILSAKAIMDLALIFKMSRELKEYFFCDNIKKENFPILSELFKDLYTNNSIEKKIFESILSENTIADNASKELAIIRRKQKILESTIKDKLNSIIHSSSYSKYIQETVITIRNGRYVIPVKEEFRGQIKGFIHDMSSSGATVFIEPLSIFEINSEISSLKIAENLEIEKILKDLSNSLSPYTYEIMANKDIIGRLDFIFAKANFSKELKAISPIINTKKQINFIKARHPLIDKNAVVPIDINLGLEFNSLIITGPNTGGKTVTLKTVGLLCSMTASGLHIPVSEGSSVYIFDNVFADIGDEQSIQESLSTFSSRMLNTIEIFKLATENSLILLDELGSGTDPIEGASLAISILENFYKRGSLCIATTHYPEIKNYALVTPGFKNASSEFDVENLRPTYKLLIGIPGRSNAFAISKKLGLDDSILQRANDFIDNDNIKIEELLKNIYDDKITIEHEKDEINKNLKQVESLRKSLERDNSDAIRKEKELIDTAKIEARRILSDAKDEASAIIKAMNDIYDSNLAIKDLNNLRNTLNDSIKSLSSSNILVSDDSNSNVNIEDLKIGTSVFITGFNQDGVVLSEPKNNKVQVQFGSTKMFVEVSKLRITGKKKTSRSGTNINTSSLSNLKAKTVSNKINVIGLNVAEATCIVDKFLDDAAISKLQKVEIVHGKGTGALRQGIHNFLKKHPHVKSFRLGTFGEGETGVTIVEIK